MFVVLSARLSGWNFPVLGSGQYSDIRKVRFEPLTSLKPREPKKQARVLKNGQSQLAGKRARPQGRPRTQWAQSLIGLLVRHTQHSKSELVNLAKDASKWKVLVEGLCRRLEYIHD